MHLRDYLRCDVCKRCPILVESISLKKELQLRNESISASLRSRIQAEKISLFTTGGLRSRVSTTTTSLVPPSMLHLEGASMAYWRKSGNISFVAALSNLCSIPVSLLVT